MKHHIPDWLLLRFQSALMFEIYGNVRAIAVGFSKNKELKVRYYLDREPTDFDRDSLQMVVSELLSHVSAKDEILSVSEDCLFTSKRLDEIDMLDGLVYARREYDVQM